MDCPRCGEPLESYRLDDSETVACGNCSYLGIPVDHKSEGKARESWDEAIDRFQEQHQTVKTVTEIDDTDVFSEVSDDEGDDEPSADDDSMVDDDSAADDEPTAPAEDTESSAESSDDPTETDDEEPDNEEHEADGPDEHEPEGRATNGGREPAPADAGD